MDNRQEVKSLKKALRALVILNQRGEATVTEVANALEIPRPTAYRLLETLAAEGYIERQENSTIYRLTSQVRELACGFTDRDLAVEVAKPLLKDLCKQLGWPIALATPVESEMVVRVTTDYEPFGQFEPAIARAQAIARRRFDAEPLLATAGHVEAVKLEFPGAPGRQVFALGDPREMTAHFDLFRAAIHLDRRALLTEHPGAPVVVLLPEPTYLYDTPAETRFREALCDSFSDIEPVETVEAPPGRLAMQTFTARVGGTPSAVARPCPFQQFW